MSGLGPRFQRGPNAPRRAYSNTLLRLLRAHKTGRKPTLRDYHNSPRCELATTLRSDFVDCCLLRSGFGVYPIDRCVSIGKYNILWSKEIAKREARSSELGSSSSDGSMSQRRKSVTRTEQEDQHKERSRLANGRIRLGCRPRLRVGGRPAFEIVTEMVLSDRLGSSLIATRAPLDYEFNVDVFRRCISRCARRRRILERQH